MKEHLHYFVGVFLPIIFLTIHPSVNITISHIFYDFLYISIFFLFYFIVKERAPECKFKTKISKEILNKAGASNGK